MRSRMAELLHVQALRDLDVKLRSLYSAMNHVTDEIQAGDAYALATFGLAVHHERTLWAEWEASYRSLLASNADSLPDEEVSIARACVEVLSLRVDLATTQRALARATFHRSVWIGN